MAINGNFQFRRAVASLWTSSNPILLSGELGLETDTDLFKIGDGTTTWNSLPYGGIKGDTGTAGRGIVSIVRTSGNGAAGTTDTYTINYTSAPLTSTFTVTNGANGVNGQSVAVLDEGSELTATASSINFVGGGVTATNSGNAVTVTIPANPTAANAAPPAIASTSSTGTTTNEYALEDHTHAGVTSVSVNGGAAQQGAVSVSVPTQADATPQPIATTGSIGTQTTMYALEDHTHAGVTSVSVNGGAATQGAVALTIPPAQLTALRSGLFTSTANSTAIQDVLTLNVPANYPLVGKHFSFLAFGTQSQSAAATNVVFIIAINDVAVATATVAGGTAAQTNRALVIEGMLQFTAVGAAGQVMGGLEQTITGIAANSQTNVAGVAVNTTAPMTLKIRCQTSTANAANIIRVAAASITER